MNFLIKEFPLMLLITFILSLIPSANTIDSGKVKPTAKPTPRPTPTEVYSPNNDNPVVVPTDYREEDDYRGIVKSKEVTEVLIEFPCVVENLKVVDGKIVRKDEVLMVLDTSLYDKQIADKKKTLEEKIKTLQETTNSVSGNQRTELQNEIETLTNIINDMTSKRQKDYVKNDSVISTQKKAVVRNLTIAQNQKVEPPKKLLELHGLSSIYIESRASKEDLDTIKIGTKVLVIDKTSKIAYEGKIANKSTANFFVLLNRENEVLVPGGEVTVRIKE